jgi:choline dehydrogenase-like flavoprotein
MKVETLIIGSGVVATALSKRLLEHKPHMEILILEAGNRVKTRDFGIWESFQVTGNYPFPQIYDLPYPERDAPGENRLIGEGGQSATAFTLNGGRALAYGGSTNVWGGWTFRRKPEDFYLKTNTGKALDWPFDYDTLEPYYCQAEDYLAVSGDSKDTTVPRTRPYPFHEFPYSYVDQPVGKAMEKLGITYGHLPIARRGVSKVPSTHAPCQVTGTCDYCPFGARFVACDYMDDFRKWNDHPNLNIKLGAVVLTIRMATKRRAAGVVYRETATGDIINVDADRVIVAAGTFESPKLLLRSTSAEWPEGIGNDTDNVGRYLITHPYMIYAGSMPLNPDKMQWELNFPTMVSRYFDTPAEQAKGKFVLVNAPNIDAVPVSKMMQNGFTNAKINRTITGAVPISLHSMVEIFGEFDNRVTNYHKVNHLGMPEATIYFQQDRAALARIQEIGQVVKKIFTEMGGTYEDGNPNVNSWRCDHAASTCRMSKDPKDGVVDADLRIHGTDNIYLCSNAVYPNLGAINPTDTVTALAFRLGDHLGAAS